MIFNRQWIALLVAGGLCSSHWLRAQDTSGGSSSSSGSSDAGASSSFGSGSTSSGGTTGSSSLFDTGTPSGTSSPFGSPSDTGTTPSTSTAAPNIFGTNPTGTAPPASGAPSSASTFGSGAGFGGPTPPPEPAPSFTLPGAYGQSAQTFTLGEGRLARPKFRYSASVDVGFDDNTLQTPTNSLGIPEVSIEEVVEPPVPEHFESVPVTIFRKKLVPGQNGPVIVYKPEVIFVPVFRKAKPAVTEKKIIQKAAPGQERAASFFTRASGNYEITLGSRRTIFTMDLRGNADYYFSRPSDQTDFNGSLSFNFLHRITPRMQFSASANLAYLSQPDIRLINGPTRNVGDYFSATSKFDLSYRWTKRFSTVTSFSFNSLLYSVAEQQLGNYYEGIFGTEARYAWSPRLTLLGEVRYGQTEYPNNSLLNSQTVYALLGAEYILSKRISTTVRLGESFRSFESGGSAATPYLESTVSWRYNPVGFLSWNTRFGFEESGSANSEVLSLRTGLSAVQAFSSRLRGSAGLTYVHRVSTIKSTGFDATEQTFDVNVGLDYAFSKRLSLNASYTFTTSISDSEVNDYYRNRIFFGAEYSF